MIDEKREVLFRGKRSGNGEWVYGSLLNNGESLYIATPKSAYTTGYYDYDDTTLGIVISEVEPNTVGEFIGLLDSNGKRIFTGDGFGNSNELRCFIEFRDFAFTVQFVDAKTAKHNSSKMTDMARLLTASAITWNIHDNPDL